MSLLDARGLSCPEPVIMIRGAMKTNESEYQIIVDNKTAKENVSRYAKHQGYEVTVKEEGGEYTLTISK